MVGVQSLRHLPYRKQKINTEKNNLKKITKYTRSKNTYKQKSIVKSKVFHEYKGMLELIITVSSCGTFKIEKEI